MTTIRVTATVAFEFDTEDGLVSTEDEAREEMLDQLASGLPAYQFQIATEAVE